MCRFTQFITKLPHFKKIDFKKCIDHRPKLHAPYGMLIVIIGLHMMLCDHTGLQWHLLFLNISHYIDF